MEGGRLKENKDRERERGGKERGKGRGTDCVCRLAKKKLSKLFLEAVSEILMKLNYMTLVAVKTI